MAKTAEEKAAAKAEKQAEKAERRAEKDQIVNLKSAQDAEIMAYREALSESDLSNKEIKALIRAEKDANREEVSSAKGVLSADGLQYIGITGTRPDGTEYKGPILSRMETIGEDYRQPIVNDIRGALSYYSDYNLPGLSARGNATIGIGIDDILKLEYSRDPETGEYTKTGNLAKTISRAQDYVKNTFTVDELTEQGVKLKQDKTNPDLYTWKFGSEENKGYIFFKQNEDGTFTGIGANRMQIDMPDSGFLGSVFKAVPFLPEIAAIGTAMIPGGQAYAGQVYAAGKGLQTASMGGDFGDVLKSAGTAYLGSTVIPGLVQGALPADLASIPGVSQGVTRATMGALSGQDIEDALMSGITSGFGNYAGAQIGDITGSQDLGRVGGALTSTALSGGDVEKTLQNVIMANAVQSGLSSILPEVTGGITDPTARRIAENSLGSIINQTMRGDPIRPSIPTPIPGIVRRQFGSSTTGAPSPLVQPKRPTPAGPVMSVAGGGRIGPPLRRNVKELIPLRRGALAMAGKA